MSALGVELGETASTADIAKLVLVMGTSGVGKSQIINMLYNGSAAVEHCDKPCQIGSGSAPVTLVNRLLLDAMHGYLYIDTVGLGDPNTSQEELGVRVKNLMTDAMTGVHAIVVVAKYGRMTDEGRVNLEAIKAIFDIKWSTNTILVLTFCEAEGDAETLTRAWLKEETDPKLHAFVKSIKGRILFTNNSLNTRVEPLYREVRTKFHSELAAFIDGCTDIVGPSPGTLLERVLQLLENTFDSFHAYKNARRTNALRAMLSDTYLQTDCPVCMDAISAALAVRTSCGHLFHSDCLDGWIDTQKTSCPMCRNEIVARSRALAAPVPL